MIVSQMKQRGYVSPIELDEENGEGVRSVLLIDYQLTVVADVDE
ncbi:hypothetical protein [Staphylococcus pettenkoferi]|uniref:Uncharacterized protein n=1 Tax=Staphylococcus pettenkoferi TaxID=170573 RepID=A0ABT4BHM2_9STAP|nr:hypothetical protein [Staphylococcus pettenkoferi]MCY1563593.1 hypothetical protein [Staphylococcus pettenkoferi]MCY1571066.1 hypothetical protein [Staphylococcus pettenkoferi]MCY1582165.1 hypothetical protein [Staphylococcus pettenkoferi]